MYVPVQVKVREFVAKILFAAVAAERGYGTVLGTHRRLRPSIHRLPRGIVWDYSATYPLLGMFRRYAAAGHKVVVCEEEGLVEVPHDAAVAVDRYLAWGQDEAERVSAAVPDASPRVRVTGHPRFDLLRPELRPLHAADVERIRRRLGRYLLVNTNFAANVQFGIPALQQTYRLDKAGFTDEDMAWFRERDLYSRRLFEEFKAVAVKLAAEFPSHTIVVRPHPSEDDDAWREAVGGLENAHVERTGSVVPWLIGADALIHNSCTTGIEAHLVGASVFSYRPIEDSRFDWDLPNQVSVEVRGIEQLARELRSLLDGGRASGFRGNEELRRHIAGMDGPLAAERMVDAIDELGSAASTLPHGIAASTAARWRYHFITLKHFVKYALRLTRIPLSYEAQKNPGWDASEVDAVLDHLRATTGRFADVAVADLWPHVVAIAPR